MKDQLKKVKEFHKAFNEENGLYPSNVNSNIYELRHKLMAEENDEYLQACKDNDLVGIADALGDKLYILCGTILKHGMHNKIIDVFNEIHSSNMSKLGENGKPLYREDGKILKGPSYFKPEIKKILDQV